MVQVEKKEASSLFSSNFKFSSSKTCNPERVDYFNFSSLAQRTLLIFNTKIAPLQQQTHPQIRINLFLPVFQSNFLVFFSIQNLHVNLLLFSLRAVCTPDNLTTRSLTAIHKTHPHSAGYCWYPWLAGHSGFC